MKTLNTKESMKQPILSIYSITNHAYQRAEERLKWNKKRLESMLSKIIINQVDTSHFKGSFKRYLKRKSSGHSVSNCAYLYGEYMFFFKDKCLITMYRIPEQYFKELGLGHNSIFARASIDSLINLL